MRVDPFVITVKSQIKVSINSQLAKFNCHLIIEVAFILLFCVINARIFLGKSSLNFYLAEIND
jgi:hypothetical protein